MSQDDEVNRVYTAVIEEVLRSAEDEFDKDGLDTSLVEELRMIWLEKINQARAAASLGPLGGGAGDQEAYDPDAAPPAHAPSEGVSAPAAALLAQGLTHVPSAAELASLATGPAGPHRPAAGRPSPTAPRLGRPPAGPASAYPPQLDGPATNDDDAEGINSDLDDQDEEAEEDNETENRLLCVHERVQRNRSRWKLSLKDGLVEIDGRDFVFHRATADLDFGV